MRHRQWTAMPVEPEMLMVVVPEKAAALVMADMAAVPEMAVASEMAAASVMPKMDTALCEAYVVYCALPLLYVTVNFNFVILFCIINKGINFFIKGIFVSYY
ncbi:unnamed protein product [Cuscuta europaea]|uniref:Uncharacterized protein n=1 Tax=Cuscuta europaea TaxID=41803 RepID=A0A9P0YNI7_CUSEU|nr:unnamed protein product [Cuscuta europaea]